MKYPYKEWWKEPKKLIKRPKLRVRSQRWIYKGILGFEPGNGWLIRLIPHNIAESGKWWSNGSLPHNMAHRLWTINDFAVLSRISRFDDEKTNKNAKHWVVAWRFVTAQEVYRWVSVRPVWPKNLRGKRNGRTRSLFFCWCFVCEKNTSKWKMVLGYSVTDTQV